MPYVIGADTPEEPAGHRFARLLELQQILQLHGGHTGVDGL